MAQPNSSLILLHLVARLIADLDESHRKKEGSSSKKKSHFNLLNLRTNVDTKRLEGYKKGFN